MRLKFVNAMHRIFLGATAILGLALFVPVALALVETIGVA
jgi:hypothetical protein